MQNKTARSAALGGINLALTMIFLFSGSFMPGFELTLYAASSLFVAVMIIEVGLKGGIGLYAAAVLLGFLLLPNKLSILPYACLFGLYGIVKYLIEKARNPILQILMKIIFFGILISGVFLFYKELFLGEGTLPDLPSALLIAIGVVFMMLYDTIFTLLINLYLTRVKKVKAPDIPLDK